MQRQPAAPHVVIVGGGFGGLYAARALRRAPVRITVVDRRNHHLFQPLLYQVASAALNPSDIAYPLRATLRRQRNAQVILGEARRIDTSTRLVHLDGDVLSYDYLILATGATHAYFGHDEWAPYAPGLKTIEDALEIRRRVLLAFEAAEREPDPEARQAWLSFVIVGAGPTGVELAGALSEIARHALARDFRDIDPTHARVVLVEGGSRVLPAFSAAHSGKAEEQLGALGVEVRTDAFVTGIDERGVTLGDTRIASRTVLWAAGVVASPLGASLGVPLDRAGRVIVDSSLRPPGVANVFVIGDLAAAATGGKPVPGIAPAAIQAGRFAAGAIDRLLRGQPLGTFHYRDKGMLATIGRSAAIARLGPLELSGFSAWVAWLAVHIFFLIGFRNRLFVMLSWAWSYLTFQRGARLITGSADRLLPPP
ncbi:MAG: NAD(P)/FAD-dependent oxidoreductase [Candidatus Schekmanbacteria bacterium]|nr:NAD(P)/FAD-dependent oxidoreductase [Candidatus Schekmanbacteria bacterium]